MVVALMAAALCMILASMMPNWQSLLVMRALLGLSLSWTTKSIPEDHSADIDRRIAHASEQPLLTRHWHSDFHLRFFWFSCRC